MKVKREDEFPGLCSEKTPAGSPRWRVRVEGHRTKKIGLPEGMGPEHPSFDEFYAAARQGVKLDLKPEAKVVRGTLDELCDRFLASMEVQVEAGNLSQLTLNSRRTGLTQARNCATPNGKRRIGELKADLPREAFAHIRNSFGAQTGAADTCLKALRAAYTWGADHGYPEDSKVFKVRSGHREKGGATPWTATDVGKFLRTHAPGSMARLWFILAYATRSRIGDAPVLGPENEVSHEGVRYIEWQPSKRGSAFVSIPMDDYLEEELCRHNSRTTYLVTEYGQPFASSGSLDNRVRKWIIAAGLCVDARDASGNLLYEGTGKKKVVKKRATRSQHGIRKGVAELMAQSGATEYELMSSFGWTEAKTAGIYTKKFQRRGAAASASRRLSTMAGVPRLQRRGTPGPSRANEIGDPEEEWQPVGESNPSFQVENLAS